MSLEIKSRYTSTYSGSSWPSREQELLLQAALLDGDQAIKSWLRWRSITDFDHLDLGSRQLLPLLYQNLHAHKIEDPLINLFRGMYRETWYKNHLTIQNMIPILQSFQNAGIQTMLLKGAALITQYYQNFGVRPLPDIAVLVQIHQAADATDLLRELGWVPRTRNWKEFQRNLFNITHSEAFVNKAGYRFDLHWHALSPCCRLNTDKTFWQGAEETQLSGLTLWALNPTDQLLNICVPGINWSPLPSILWTADALIVVNTCQSKINWEQLLEQADKRRLVLQLGSTMKYLRDLLNAPFPVEKLDKLQVKPVSGIEKLEFQSLTRRPGLMGRLPRIWFRYLRWSQPADYKPLQVRFKGFAGYLQQEWGLDHLWQVPLRFATQGIKRIRDYLMGIMGFSARFRGKRSDG